MPSGVGKGLQCESTTNGARFSTSAAVALRPGQHESAQSCDAVQKAKATRGYRLAAVGGIGLAISLGVAIFYSPAKQTIALYKRSAASVQACEAAGAEIARLRRATLFMDDCSAPVVTPLFGCKGQVIVTRTVQGDADDDDGGRVSYSLKMDGIDTWLPLQVRRAPSELTLDASRLPTGGSVVPTSAQR